MKIQKRNNSKNPTKVFWYCKVCKCRREEWKSKQKYSAFPFCSSDCKVKFYRNHAFTSSPNSYKKFFTQERFKIWLHNQISMFSPQFTHIRQDHTFRKIVRDEMWDMRYNLSLGDAIHFIVFMMNMHNIPFVKDKELYFKLYGTHITTQIMSNMNLNQIPLLEEAQKMLEEE